MLYIGFLMLILFVCLSGYCGFKAVNSHRYSITRKVWLYPFYVFFASGMLISFLLVETIV